jgi:hypothetical protein
MKFVTCNVRSIYSAGLLTAVVRESAKYKSDSEEVKDVRRNGSGTGPAGDNSILNLICCILSVTLYDLLIMLLPSSVIFAYNITLVFILTCFGLVRDHLQRLMFKILLGQHQTEPLETT